MPTVIALYFRFVREPNRSVAFTLAVAALDLAFVHPTYALFIERLLLGDRGAPVRAADDYPPQRPRRAAELAFDDRAIIHPARS